MICSFLLPSRGNPVGLLRSIESICATAHDVNDIEILLRFDEDDLPTVTAWNETIQKRCAEICPNISATIGPREAGYSSLREFCTRMAKQATGMWLAMWNDDAVMVQEGEFKWDVQLRQLPITGVIVQPGCYRLNESRYDNCVKSAFPFFPHHSWDQFDVTFWPDPADYSCSELLVGQRNWRTYFLEGITVWHDRVPDRWK